VLFGLLLVLPARTASAAPSLDVVVARTVRGNYGALHGCYRKVLAEDRTRGGTLFVRITLGAGDAVKAVRAERDELGNAGATACILGWIRGWTFAGAAASGAGAGSEITVPLTFRPAPDQFLVRAEDARELDNGPGNVARVLLHTGSVGAARASMVLHRVTRAVFDAVPGDQALYVLFGPGLMQWGRRGSRKLRVGMAVWVPAGVSVVCSARRAGEPMMLLQLFVPGGPEVRYRSRPADRARKQPPARRATPVVVSPLPASVKQRIIPRLDRRAMRHTRFSLLEVRLGPGEELRRTRPAEDELCYVVGGSGTATRPSSSSVELAGGSAMYYPPRTPHAVKGAGPMRLIQLLAPAPSRVQVRKP